MLCNFFTPEIFTAIGTWGLAFLTYFLARATIRAANEQTQSMSQVVNSISGIADSNKEIASVKILIIYIEQFEGKNMLSERSALATLILKNASHEEQQEHETVLDFFETVGLLVRRKLIDVEMVWSNFGYYAIRWAKACEPYIKKERELKNNDTTIFEDFMYLTEEMYKMEEAKRKMTRKDVTPDDKDMNQFLKDETNDE